MACIATLLISLPTLADDYGLAKGMVRFRVIDDQGDPVAGANALVFDVWTTKGYKGLTDTNGYFSCNMRKIYPPIGGQFTKPGYYKTQGEVWMGDFGVLPTNTLTVTLKRIVNPVPMVKREVNLLFPVLEEPVGFDFEKGDWIDPYGTGTRPDAWITGVIEWRTRDDFVLKATLVTSNKYDGFVGFDVSRVDSNDHIRSDLPAPQQASEDANYVNSIQAYRTAVPRKGRDDSYDKNVDYYFRFRTHLNDQGTVDQANVGWIDNGIRMTFKENRKTDEKKRLRITFAYYYNPDLTSRSLEPKEIADKQ